jgi:hypothetical protein
MLRFRRAWQKSTTRLIAMPSCATCPMVLDFFAWKKELATSQALRVCNSSKSKPIGKRYYLVHMLRHLGPPAEIENQGNCHTQCHHPHHDAGRKGTKQTKKRNAKNKNENEKRKTKNEKRKTKNEKRKTKNETRKTRHEKRKTKNEKRKTKNEKQNEKTTKQFFKKNFATRSDDPSTTQSLIHKPSWFLWLEKTDAKRKDNPSKTQPLARKLFVCFDYAPCMFRKCCAPIGDFKEPAPGKNPWGAQGRPLQNLPKPNSWLANFLFASIAFPICFESFARTVI